MATNTNIETVGTTADRLKIALAVLAVIAGLAGFYLLSQQALVLRIAAVLAGLIVGAGIASTSEPGKRFFAFGRESIARNEKGGLAVAQGNDPDHGGRVRLRDHHGRVPVGDGQDARIRVVRLDPRLEKMMADDDR